MSMYDKLITLENRVTDARTGNGGYMTREILSEFTDVDLWPAGLTGWQIFNRMVGAAARHPEHTPCAERRAELAKSTAYTGERPMWRGGGYY